MPDILRETVLRALGDRIRRLREERSLSRRELAGSARLSERFLAQIETGRGNPSVASLLQIAGALETTASALLARPPRAGGIALLGLRGAGKSTVGRALARKLRFEFVELDQQIEESAGLALEEIFVLHGETYYRELERRAVRSLFPRDAPVVVAASGGIVTNAEAFDSLRAHSRAVWLRARPDDHWNRVVAQGDHRPMANDPLAMERLRSLLAEREPLYAKADLTVETSGRTPQAIVDELATWWKNQQKRK